MRECPEKKIPSLWPVNSEVVELFNLALPFLQNGMGGYDSNALQNALDSAGIEQRKRPGYMRRFGLLVGVLDKEFESRKKGNGASL